MRYQTVWFSQFVIVWPTMYEKRLVYFYKLQDVIQERRQRNLCTEQARHLLHERNANFHDQQGVTFVMMLKLINMWWLVYHKWYLFTKRLNKSCLMLNTAHAIEKSSEIFWIAIASFSQTVLTAFFNSYYIDISLCYPFLFLIRDVCSRGCFNGGSCLPDKENWPFSCLYLPPWTRDRCEVRSGNNYMTVKKTPKKNQKKKKTQLKIKVIIFRGIRGLVFTNPVSL